MYRLPAQPAAYRVCRAPQRYVRCTRTGLGRTVRTVQRVVQPPGDGQLTIAELSQHLGGAGYTKAAIANLFESRCNSTPEPEPEPEPEPKLSPLPLPLPEPEPKPSP